MAFSLGDKVMIKDTGDEGTVVALLSSKMVMIDVDAFQFPVQISDLLLLGKTEILYPPAPDPLVTAPADKPAATDTIQAIFTPVLSAAGVAEAFKLYLVNDSAWNADFNFSSFFRGILNFSISKNLPSFSDFYLFDIELEQLNEQPKLVFELQLSQGKFSKNLVRELKPKGKQFFRPPQPLILPGQVGYAFELYRDEKPKPQPPPDMSKLKELTLDEDSPPEKFYSGYYVETGPAKEVIDIHIEKIFANYQHLSNYEIVQIQLAYFVKHLERAIASNLYSFTVIHGKGEGKLKEEVHKILRTYKEVRSFRNEWSAGHGYGATVIYL